MESLRAIAGLSGMAVASDFSEGAAAVEEIKRGGRLFLDEIGVAVVSVEPDQAKGLLSSIRGPHSPILAVEPERVVYSAEPSDVLSWDESSVTWGLQAIGVPSTRYSGAGVNVALLDTGIDKTHPDLADRIEIEQSFVPGEDVQDGAGHGTHCAGTICGPKRPQSRTRYGIAYNVGLMVAKVLDNNERGEEGAVLAGIRWAVANGCRVISMSLSSRVRKDEPHSMVFEVTAQRLLRRGIVMVAAAGNDSSRAKSIVAPVGRPASSPSIVAVGALDQQLQVADFSNGSTGDGRIDIVAPGVAILSSFLLKENIRYARTEGTSMATPHVTSVLALLAEAHPDLMGTDAVERLINGARALPASSADVGAGLVQAP